MKTISWLVAAILLCGIPTLGEELPKGSIVLSFRLKVEMGGRTTEMAPKVAVADGQVAELEVFSDEGEKEYVRLSVTPRLLKDNKVDLEIIVSSRLAEHSIQRKLRLTALLESESLYQTIDAGNNEKISLTVKPHLVE
jgi:hypothetical protein